MYRFLCTCAVKESVRFCLPNSDHVIFSREFAFRLFIYFAYTCARSQCALRRHLKETVICGTIKWSKMQDRKTKPTSKKVYWKVQNSRNIYSSGVGVFLVCYTAVFSVVTQRSSLLVGRSVA